MENTDELEKLIEESPYGDFVSSTDKTIYLLQRMSLSLKGAAISLFRLQGTAKGSLEPLHYLKQTQEFLFSFHLNSLALAKKVGLPSSEEEQDATVYPSLVIFSQARALTPEFALLRGRVISYLRRPTSDMYLLLETAIHRIHQTVVRLQTEIASAMADPLTLNVVNADEARGSKCYLETGARTSVAVRPVLSFGYAYGLEAIKHESDVQTMWDLAKQAAHSLSQITHTATLNDHRKELNEIQGRSRIWEMLLRMVRAHANGRRSADDKHLLLEAAAETRLAFSELWQTEIRCCQTGSYSGSVARLTQLAQKLASVSEKMFREILAVRTRESKISSKTEASLWEEAEQEGVNIIYDKTSKVKKIKSASLNRLIVRVTDTKVPDPQLTKAFLRTYSNFCTPAKLLEKLIERYEVPTDKNAREGLTRTEHHKTIVQPIQARVYNFLKSWIDSQFGEDFDHALLTRLNNFLENKMMRDGNERLAKALISRISKELRELMASNIEKPLAPVEHADDFLLELPEQVFAEQITARFFDIYRKIKPVELLGLAWSKEKLRHRAPNVTYMISEFNRYSAWLQTRIVSQTHLRQRAKVYGKILRVALILRELQNFDTLIDMIAVTNSSAIRRLVHTKEAAGAKLVADFDRMKEQVTGGRNWANYREIVRTSKTPLLPYLGTYLTDLTFIDEGNKDFSAGLINFGKSLLIYNVLSDIEQYQRDPFVFAPDPNIQAAWDQATIESETAIFARSSKVEPKGANKMDLLQ